jgi:hypothetical protein
MNATHQVGDLMATLKQFKFKDEEPPLFVDIQKTLVEMNYCLSKETYTMLRMALENERSEACLQQGKLPPWEDVVECMAHVEQFPIPRWYLIEREMQYRKGFYYGFYEAARMVSLLYKKGGYVRPMEIFNILINFCDVLRKWRNQTSREDPIQEFGEPKLAWEKWSKLRRLVLERDEGRCVWCDSTENLEVDHIEEVRNGGLPEMENLRTLCRQCHDTRATNTD